MAFFNFARQLAKASRGPFKGAAIWLLFSLGAIHSLVSAEMSFCGLADWTPPQPPPIEKILRLIGDDPRIYDSHAFDWIRFLGPQVQNLRHQPKSTERDRLLRFVQSLARQQAFTQIEPYLGEMKEPRHAARIFIHNLAYMLWILKPSPVERAPIQSWVEKIRRQAEPAPGELRKGIDRRAEAAAAHLSWAWVAQSKAADLAGRDLFKQSMQSVDRKAMQFLEIAQGFFGTPKELLPRYTNTTLASLSLAAAAVQAMGGDLFQASYGSVTLRDLIKHHLLDFAKLAESPQQIQLPFLTNLVSEGAQSLAWTGVYLANFKDSTTDLIRQQEWHLRYAHFYGGRPLCYFAKAN